MLNKLAAVPAQTLDAVTAHVLETLGTNTYDIPLAMLYKLEDGAESPMLQLRGQFGLPEGHRLLIDKAKVDSTEGLIPDLQRAGSEVIFMDYDDRFESVSWKGWEVPPKQIAILPIVSSDRLFGYLVIGMNPYRPFDDACRAFAQDLNRMVSTILSAAVNFELAEDRREQLESDLAFSNLKVRHLVEHTSVGMCHASVDGELLWANDRYFELAGKSAEEHAANYSFYNAYLEEDLPKVEQVWNDLVAGVVHNNVELRLKRTFISPTGEETPVSIRSSGFPIATQSLDESSQSWPALPIYRN